MKTSKEGIELVKQFEGLSLEAYKCPAGVWTIGYGHTHDVFPGMRISNEAAEKYLIADLHSAESAVTHNVKSSISQNQFDALVDFVHNVGAGNFKSSTLLKKINLNPNDPEIPDEFRKWKFSTVGGKKVILAGLVRRRDAEANLYMRHND